MVRNTCTVNYMEVPDWHIDIGGNYEVESLASVWLHVERDRTQTEQSLNGHRQLSRRPTQITTKQQMVVAADDIPCQCV